MKKRGKKIPIYDEPIYQISFRYIVLLALMFSLPVIYFVFTPLTIYPVAYFLDIFYEITINKDIIIMNFDTPIQIVDACVAGAAYLLLLMINLTVPMKFVKRIYSILLSFIILLALNITRIIILAILYEEEYPYFDFTHKLFWYGLSTFFVVAIWFFIVKIYKIESIPVYTDIRTFIIRIKKGK